MCSTDPHGDHRVDLVVPTIGRPSLRRLLAAIAAERAAAPTAIGRLIVVDDRRLREPAILAPAGGDVLASGGRGPAAARNVGWQASDAGWVCFLDDDVVPRAGWLARLVDDIGTAAPNVAAIQGNVHVPMPEHRPPTDGERNVAGLDGATWITADMALRRSALESIGGFDERFGRAYREDSDLALRLVDAGWELRLGSRHVDHPPSSATWRQSVRSQRGNADDALVARLHGDRWRDRIGAPRGVLRTHVATTATAAGAGLAAACGRHRVAAVALGAWGTMTARFWWRRAAPGPRQPKELVSLAISSLLIPPAATWWTIAGRFRHRDASPSAGGRRLSPHPPRLVLFDRDGTLIEDVPYNGDPQRVVPRAGARAALDRLRGEGIKLGIVTNQSGVARGLIAAADVDAVNRRVAELLGPFDVVEVCVHDQHQGCACRKPAPGMILAAAGQLGIDPAECAVIGDIDSDVDAATAAGARGILVPAQPAVAGAVSGAVDVAGDLGAAVEMLLAPRPELQR